MTLASDFLGGIKSIQSGTLSASAASHTITINAVNTAQCVLIVERAARGAYFNGSSYTCGCGSMVLTSSTALTYTQPEAYNSQIVWRLVEFSNRVPIKSRQFVSVGTGAVSGTTSITSVTPEKSIVTFNGATYSQNPTNGQDTGMLGSAWLQDATTLAFAPINQGMAGNRFQITEFY